MSISGRLWGSPHLLLTLTTLFWAGNITLGKTAALGYVPPFTLSFWRWAIALLILLPFGLRPILAQRSLYRTHWPLMVALGVLSIAAYNTLQYWALGYTGAINVAVIGSIMPGGIFLLTWLAGQEKANAVQLLGLLLLVVGVLVVVLQGRVELVLDLSLNIGDVAVLAAVAMFCLYSVLLRRLPRETNQIGLLTILVAVGVVGIAPFHAWEAVNKPPMRLAWESFAIIGYVGLFPSVLAYLFWNRAIALAGANLAAVMMNLTTVFVSVIAVLFLGEHFEWFHLAGMILIFAGIFLAIIVGRRRRVRQVAPD